MCLTVSMRRDPNNYHVSSSSSTQLIMKFLLLINVKMPTIVGMLTYMSRKINVKLSKIVGVLTFMGRKNSILGFSGPKKKIGFLDIFILMSI